MRYFGFESGSRAGLSTELFFEDYRSNVQCNDTLLLADIDENYLKVVPTHPFVKRISDSEAKQVINEKDFVFPCDELTRQSDLKIGQIASLHSASSVERVFYNKIEMNTILSQLAKGLKIPKTFCADSVFVKPNVMSAGSKGCRKEEKMCVSEYIDIKNEYVVDCLKGKETINIFPRQVILKNGYDKYVRLIPAKSNIGYKVVEFIQSVKGCGLFDGIFHVQIAEDYDGNFYYIEASKRISGSSIVNLTRGFNPFFFINGIKRGGESRFKELEWYRFEDFII